MKTTNDFLIMAGFILERRAPYSKVLKAAKMDASICNCLRKGCSSGKIAIAKIRKN